MPTQVLIADPDQSSCDALARNLVSWGYEPIVATNGTEAWGILQKAHAPRVALFDSALQGVNALELCQLVRDMRGDDSVILVSVQSGGSTVEALEAGADGVLVKPVHMRELRMRLAAGLRGRRLVASEVPASSAPLSTKDPADSALAGRVVAGKYRIERLIGKGGMGTVWKGTHLTLGTTVAIKFIKGEYALHDLARARFALEARSAARVQTKYAVKVFDHGVTEGGLPYIVMEYLAGPSLMDQVRACGPMSFSETVTLIAQVAHALEQLHACGTIHRDVKPDNILLVQDPDAPSGRKRRVAKIIDFGVAKVLASAPAPADGEGNAVSTQQGIVIGTPNYMPPELLTGQEDPNVGADVWALAACAFTAITGRIPFEGATLPDVVKAVCRKPPPVPSQVDPTVADQFDAWFARACSRDPAKRFRSARELARALTEAYADYTDAGLEMTPSLKSFISLPAPPLSPSPSPSPSSPSSPSRDGAASSRPTVQPAQVRVLDLDAPTLVFT